MDKLPEKEISPRGTEPIVLNKSIHGQPNIEVIDASPKIYSILRKIMTSNRMDDLDYQIRTSVGAFLQGDQSNWMLIEFWKGTPEEHQSFVDYVNARITSTLE